MNAAFSSNAAPLGDLPSAGRRQGASNEENLGSTYDVCQAADAAYEQYLSDGQVRQGLENLHEYCLDSDCQALEAEARAAVKQLFEEKCWNADDENANTVEGTVLCDAVEAVASGAASVLSSVATFCQGGPCELIAAIEHIHEPPCTALSNRRQKHVESNHSTCSQLDAFTTSLIDEQCRPGRNWTMVNNTNVTIFEESICRLVHELVLENDFDDDDDEILHHGTFWKQADKYCAASIKTKTECKAIVAAAKLEIANVCPDDASVNTSTLCTAAKFINQNWESIDGTLVKIDSVYRAICNESASVCDVKAVADWRANVTSKALAFCNVTSFDLAAAFVDDDDNSGDDNDDDDAVAKNHHHWVRLAEQCPNLIAKARDAVADYCDVSAPFECAVVSSIPWKEVPFDDDGGPVLSFLVDAVIPKVKADTDELFLSIHPALVFCFVLCLRYFLVNLNDFDATYS